MCPTCRWFSGSYAVCFLWWQAKPSNTIHSLLFAAVCVQLWVLFQPSKCIIDPVKTKSRQCNIELSLSLSQPASTVLPDDSVCQRLSRHHKYAVTAFGYIDDVLFSTFALIWSNLV